MNKKRGGEAFPDAGHAAARYYEQLLYRAVLYSWRTQNPPCGGKPPPLEYHEVTIPSDFTAPDWLNIFQHIDGNGEIQPDRQGKVSNPNGGMQPVPPGKVENPLSGLGAMATAFGAVAGLFFTVMIPSGVAAGVGLGAGGASVGAAGAGASAGSVGGAWILSIESGKLAAGVALGFSLSPGGSALGSVGGGLGGGSAGSGSSGKPQGLNFGPTGKIESELVRP